MPCTLWSTTDEDPRFGWKTSAHYCNKQHLSLEFWLVNRPISKQNTCQPTTCIWSTVHQSQHLLRLKCAWAVERMRVDRIFRYFANYLSSCMLYLKAKAKAEFPRQRCMHIYKVLYVIHRRRERRENVGRNLSVWVCLYGVYRSSIIVVA